MLLRTARFVGGWVFAIAGFIFAAFHAGGGFLAYWNNFDGWVRYLGGLSPVSALLLPIIGKGRVFGLPVRSFMWWWVFLGGVACAGLARVLLGRVPRIPAWRVDEFELPDLADLADREQSNREAD